MKTDSTVLLCTVEQFGPARLAPRRIAVPARRARRMSVPSPNALAALGLTELADRFVAVGGWSNALEGTDRDVQESWRWTLQLFTHRRMANGAELIQRVMRNDPRFVATIVTPATPGRGDVFSDLNGVCQVDDERSVWAIVAAASWAATKGVCDEAIQTLKKRQSDLALIAFVAEIAKVDAREAEGLLPHVARFLAAGGWEVVKRRCASARWLWRRGPAASTTLDIRPTSAPAKARESSPFFLSFFNSMVLRASVGAVACVFTNTLDHRDGCHRVWGRRILRCRFTYGWNERAPAIPLPDANVGRGIEQAHNFAPRKRPYANLAVAARFGSELGS